ncbi:hypothetical protein JI666_17620 [Bacillus sp. NTK071]|nr:hypothetical protein [Bacillus sp. NTK071]
MLKKVIGRSLLSTIILGLIVWAASALFSFSYLEWSFLIGLAISVVLYFFNSSGGLLSKGTNFEASQAGWKIQSDNELKVNVGAVFYGAVLYTIISLVVTIITYY